MTHSTQTADGFLETYRGVAHPWLADVMGHMNSRHHAALFDDASWHFLGSLGYQPDRTRVTGLGWADVVFEIQYINEVPIGSLLIIKTRLIELGNSSLATEHIMINASDNKLHAKCRTKSVHFDTNKRKACPITGELRERLSALLDQRASSNQ